ncbi:MAG: GDSL-type esterase/lipase family protein [Paracoccaceae bacterium]
MLKNFKNHQWLSSVTIALGCTFSSFAFADTANVMVFGDSNTWGWVPVENVAPTTRYPKEVRWPGVAQAALGSDYDIIEEGLSGRNSAFQDAGIPIAGEGVDGDGAGMDADEYLPAAIASNLPLDLVVIMLGTNDARENLNLSAEDIAANIMKLGVEVSQNTGVFTTYDPAKVLIVAPPHIGNITVDWLAESYSQNSVEKTTQLAGILEPLAEAAGFGFFDAGSVASIDGIDGLHMSPESHKAIGDAIAVEISEMLE